MDFMKDKRILYVSSEVIPYLPETDTASTSFELARLMHGKSAQIRIFMPRFGVINERRHQLHEVIRLSGMNLIINDMDMPLIIKVASIPKERMQVYFIDNDEYFKRKAIYTDENGKLFDDNDERAIFFAKGVIETVKKLNWTPDIIHVHGWMASLLPLYLREYYKNDPLYINSKIVTSVYDGGFKDTIGDKLIDKIRFDGINDEKLQTISKTTYNNLIKIAIENSDAVIKGSENIPQEIAEFIDQKEIPVLGHQSGDDLSDIHSNFYLTEVL